MCLARKEIALGDMGGLLAPAALDRVVDLGGDRD